MKTKEYIKLAKDAINSPKRITKEMVENSIKDLKDYSIEFNEHEGEVVLLHDFEKIEISRGLISLDRKNHETGVYKESGYFEPNLLPFINIAHAYCDEQYFTYKSEDEVIGAILIDNKQQKKASSVVPFSADEIIKLIDTTDLDIEYNEVHFCCYGHQKECWYEVEGIGYGWAGANKDLTQARIIVGDIIKKIISDLDVKNMVISKQKKGNFTSFTIPNRHKNDCDYYFAFFEKQRQEL